jgi:hypothetical protein
MRSWVGRQERYHLWQPLCPVTAETKLCTLEDSTGHRSLAEAGEAAQESVKGQLEGIPSSGTEGGGGLCTRLRSQRSLAAGSVGVGDGVNALAEAVLSRERSWSGNGIGCGEGTSDRDKRLAGYARYLLVWVQHQCGV